MLRAAVDIWHRWFFTCPAAMFRPTRSRPGNLRNSRKSPRFSQSCAVTFSASPSARKRRVRPTESRRMRVGRCARRMSARCSSPFKPRTREPISKKFSPPGKNNTRSILNTGFPILRGILTTVIIRSSIYQDCPRGAAALRPARSVGHRSSPAPLQTPRREKPKPWLKALSSLTFARCLWRQEEPPT